MVVVAAAAVVVVVVIVCDCYILFSLCKREEEWIHGITRDI
jgi:hypothetical protein